MNLTEIIKEGKIKKIYSMPQGEYENNRNIRFFRLGSRAGGAAYMTIGACLLAFASDEPSLASIVAITTFLAEGIGDLVSGRHHYLPVRGYIYAADRLGRYFKNR